VSVKGNQVFNFPDGFVLKAGATVLITSGTGAVDGAGQLKWTTANVHNNDEEDPAELYNAAREKVSEYQ
jgi:competence protein ComEC